MIPDKRLLSPLVAEYDAHIKNLKKQLAAHEEEEKHLGKQTQKLIEENHKLTRELKEQVVLVGCCLWHVVLNSSVVLKIFTLFSGSVAAGRIE